MCIYTVEKQFYFLKNEKFPKGGARLHRTSQNKRLRRKVCTNLTKIEACHVT